MSTPVPFQPGPPPAPLTPTELRARRGDRLALIRASQRQGLTPLAPILPRRHDQPAGRLFDPHDIRRCPVVFTPAARLVVHVSCHQGRLWPQALEETFGSGAQAVERVEVEVVPKGHPFPDHPHVQGVTYPDHQTEAPAVVLQHVLDHPHAWLLRVTAVHAQRGVPPHSWHLNVTDLFDHHPTNRHPLFNAVLWCNELLLLYPHHDEES